MPLFKFHCGNNDCAEHFSVHNLDAVPDHATSANLISACPTCKYPGFYYPIILGKETHKNALAEQMIAEMTNAILFIKEDKAGVPEMENPYRRPSKDIVMQLAHIPDVAQLLMSPKEKAHVVGMEEQS